MLAKKHDYIATVGRRKSAIARVRVSKKSDKSLSIKVNDRDFKEYFSYFEWQDLVVAPLRLVGQEDKIITVHVLGGGLRGQADAVRLGIARALIILDPAFRTTLKKAGMLTRDSRIKERKKPGLKKARRAPQWSKR